MIKLKDILVEYSQAAINKLLSKYNKIQDSEKKEALFYINRFDQIKNKLQNKDITTYSWKDLKDTVNSNLPEEIPMDEKLPPSTKIYDENNLEIYRMETKEGCVDFGRNYRFCISSKDSNAYTVYKYEMDKSIYFVIDRDRDRDKKLKEADLKFKDPYHLLVIMVNPEGEKKNEYQITTSENNTVITSWDKISKIQPKLKNLKYLFKYVDNNPKSKEYLKFKIEKEYNYKLGRLSRYLDYYEILGLITDINNIGNHLQEIKDIVNKKNKKAIEYIPPDKEYAGSIGVIKSMIPSFRRWKKERGYTDSYELEVGNNAEMRELDIPKDIYEYYEEVLSLYNSYTSELSKLHYD